MFYFSAIPPLSEFLLQNQCLYFCYNSPKLLCNRQPLSGFITPDLNTVEEKLKTGQYRRLGDFVKDVMKIFDNCRYYNPSDSSFYQCAEVLETFFVQKLKVFKEKKL